MYTHNGKVARYNPDISIHDRMIKLIDDGIIDTRAKAIVFTIVLSKHCDDYADFFLHNILDVKMKIDSTFCNILELVYRYAMLNNHPKVVKLLNGSNYRDYTHLTNDDIGVINYAIIHDYVDVVRYALNNIVTVSHYSNDWMIYYAVKNDSVEMLQVLLDHGIKIGSLKDAILSCAVANNSMKMVSVLRDKGYVTPNDAHIAIKAAKNNNLDMLKYIIYRCNINKGISHALIHAVENENVAMVKFLLEVQSVNVNYLDWNAVKVALDKENKVICDILMSNEQFNDELFASCPYYRFLYEYMLTKGPQ